MTSGELTRRPHDTEPLALDLIDTQWMTREGLQDALATHAATRAWLEEHQLWHERLDLSRLQRELCSVRAILRGILEQPADKETRQKLNAILERGVTLDALGDDGPIQQVRVADQDRPVWLAAHNLLELLRTAPHRIKRCANPDCVLYFYDTSPKNARRWHDMKVCGNRVKAARHYQRSRNRREDELGRDRAGKS